MHVVHIVSPQKTGNQQLRSSTANRASQGAEPQTTAGCAAYREISGTLRGARGTGAELNWSLRVPIRRVARAPCSKPARPAANAPYPRAIRAIQRLHPRSRTRLRRADALAVRG